MKNEDIKKKDIIKERIIIFAIGVLIGAVISTGAFFAYIKLAGDDTMGNQCRCRAVLRPRFLVAVRVVLHPINQATKIASQQLRPKSQITNKTIAFNS